MKKSRSEHSELPGAADERTRNAIKVLTEICHQEESLDALKMYSTPGGVEGIVQGNNKNILLKFLSPEKEIEPETIYYMFLRILDRGSHKGVIISPSQVSENIANLAELYDIKIIVLGTRVEIERSLRETLYQTFR